jgi:hypothetical protein
MGGRLGRQGRSADERGEQYGNGGFQMNLL